MAAPALAGTPAERTLEAVEQSGYPLEERTMLRQEVSRALQAGVPAEDLEVIVLRGRERGASAAAVRDLADIAAQAREQGLPLRPVLDRIEQGLAKGVPPERITAASRQLIGHLTAAGPLVDSLAKGGLRTGSSRERAEVIESVARARERSVPDAVLLKTGERAGEHGRSMASFDRAVRSLTFFVGSGMPADAAERVIGESMERGFTEKDYARLERSVGETIRRGGTMDDAMRAAEREIREGRGSGEGRSGGTQERGSGGGKDPGGRGGRGR
jgi:predicted nucleic acid-binding protein